MPAILFGSISSLVDTSDLQRAAFNMAFDQHGLGWSWDRNEYQGLLTRSGGQQRISEYAARRGQHVDAAAIHETKSHLFQQTLGNVPQLPRPGVVDTMNAAREHGWLVALVTTTSASNVDAMLDSVAGTLSREEFALIVDVSMISEPKPDPQVYEFALDQLGLTAADCVAIEDNIGGCESARGAGVACVAFANENTAGHDFGDIPRTARLSFDELTGLVAA